jgi:hypothetical protein
MSKVDSKVTQHSVQEREIRRHENITMHSREGGYSTHLGSGMAALRVTT